MKKLLFQLDTDQHVSVFDTVVAYDGGADHVVGYSECIPSNIRSLVEGAIFTRAEKDKKNTAMFIGGSDLNVGESLLDAVKDVFFSKFRVSVMLDCNGCNTTAAAAVKNILESGDISGKKAVILAGTGPVGSRAAVMLARQGARVAITSRTRDRSLHVCKHLHERYGVEIEACEAMTNKDRAGLISDANIVFATGSAGVQLLGEDDWMNNRNIEIIVDANTIPPLGIGGAEMTDRGEERYGKIIWGALGFGALKLALQRECISRLFDRNDQVLDVDEILAIACNMK